MLQLIETICFENGGFHRIKLHEERMNRSRLLLFGYSDRIVLSGLLNVPDAFLLKKVKCRISYAYEITSIEYELYCPRIVKSLKLVIDNTIEYSHKFKNRDRLTTLHNQCGIADEILIVKNGMVTDTSFSNVVFLKDGIWYTPKFPLLNGTRRTDYLLMKKIFPKVIRLTELHLFEEVRLINAMSSLEDAGSISIDSIFW
jgi:4-amino-4-deoxychorismate lyase